MKTYIFGNWKMNFSVGESSIYLQKLLKKMNKYRDVDVVVAPSTIALQSLSLQVDRRKIKLAAQNAYYKDLGPYTGETSVSQLRGIASYCIVGHSERRHIFNETDKETRAKCAACLRYNISPILCIGETDIERSLNETESVVKDQLLGGLADVSAEDLSKVFIAYEPVWAISGHKGSKSARPDEIQPVIEMIRETLKSTYSKKVAEQIPILYGGSVNSSTAGAYLQIPGVNGLLIGGASLIADEFLAIIELAKKLNSEQ